MAAANKKRKNEEVSKAALESSPTKSVVLDEDANPAKVCSLVSLFFEIPVIYLRCIHVVVKD